MANLILKSPESAYFNSLSPYTPINTRPYLTVGTKRTYRSFIQYRAVIKLPPLHNLHPNMVIDRAFLHLKATRVNCPYTDCELLISSLYDPTPIKSLTWSSLAHNNHIRTCSPTTPLSIDITPALYDGGKAILLSPTENPFLLELAKFPPDQSPYFILEYHQKTNAPLPPTPTTPHPSLPTTPPKTAIHLQLQNAPNTLIPHNAPIPFDQTLITIETGILYDPTTHTLKFTKTGYYYITYTLNLEAPPANNTIELSLTTNTTKKFSIQAPIHTPTQITGNYLYQITNTNETYKLTNTTGEPIHLTHLPQQATLIILEQ